MDHNYTPWLRSKLAKFIRFILFFKMSTPPLTYKLSYYSILP